MEEYKNLNIVLNQIVDEFVRTYKDALISNGKVASGNLVRSIKANPSKLEGRYYTGSISIADYWQYVEYGRRPGKFPPPNNIINWILDKNILPRPTTLQDANKLQSLSYLIGRKIAERGIKPTGLFQQCLDKVLTKYNNKLEEAVSKDIDQQLIIIFKNINN